MIKKLKIERTIFLTCLTICLIVLVLSGLEAKATQAEIKELQYKNSRQAAQILDRELEIELLEIMLEHQEEKSKPKETYAGEFEISYYCPCTACCGKTDGITASGTLAKEGQTVAADWDMFPPGTEIYIEGIGYRTVEDKGGAIIGKRLDVYTDSHSAALEAGRHTADVLVAEDIDE